MGDAGGGLVLLGASLAGATLKGAAAPDAGGFAAWLALSTVVAVASMLGSSRLAAGAGFGVAAGILYAGGDVATKAATFGGGWLVVVPLVFVLHGGAFVSMQFGFQRGGPLATAGTATLLTNALPILSGLLIFHEQLPAGALGIVRAVAFACTVLGAAALVSRPRRASATRSDPGSAQRSRKAAIASSSPG